MDESMKANVLEKIYLSKDSIESIPNDDPLLQILSIKEDGDIEFIRTDAFIEKACAYFRDREYTEDFIEDFKRAMKL